MPDEAWLVALAGLPGMGPARLLALHRAAGPVGAWRRVMAGRVSDLVELHGRLGRDPAGLIRRWAAEAARLDVMARWDAHVRAGLQVAALGSPRYPAALAADPEPPAVLFLRGDAAVLDGPRVAVVGTRNCTRVGREIAIELGRGLAAADVRVVSGLALGIDGAAHRGALDAGRRATAAPPVAVVAGGLDVVYPRRHLELQREVERRGLIVSEAPLGTPPEPWRFPARNRIIAALSQAVVVVESREVGGSMHTADEALERGIPVLAVPGGVRSPASSGTNLLLAEGAAPARDVDDVLVLLGLGGRPTPHRSPRAPAPVPHDPRLQRVLEAMSWESVTFEQLASRTGMALATLAELVNRLEAEGWVSRAGGWLERTGGGRG